VLERIEPVWILVNNSFPAAQDTTHESPQTNAVSWLIEADGNKPSEPLSTLAPSLRMSQNIFPQELYRTVLGLKLFVRQRWSTNMKSTAITVLHC